MRPRDAGPLILAAGLLLGALAACTGDGGGEAPAGTPERSGEPALPTGEGVLARWQGGELDAAELDLAIRRRGLAGQLQRAEDREAWRAELIRRLATERLLLAEAELVGADRDPEMRRAERHIRRELVSELYLRRHADRLEPLGEEEIAARYEAEGERFQRPERRATYHIFRHRREGEEHEALAAELEELRRRTLAGESFQLLAREHSDSETRFRDGLLGNVERGMFSEDFDRVVFALEEGVPSEPVNNADGGHVFLVSTVLEARSFSLEEVRGLLRSELERERLGGLLEELAAELPLPADSFVPERPELSRLLRSADPNTVLLRLGDFELTREEFLGLVEERHRAGGGKPGEVVLELYGEIRSKEILYQHMREEGLPELPEGAFESRFEEALAEHMARRKMTSLVERSPEVIQEYFDTHRMRYATPARLHLRRLSIPVERATPALMAELEAVRAELDAGAFDLEDLAARHGGTVEEIGPVAATAFERRDPKALRFAFLLAPGEHSPAYTTARALVLFQLLERRDPEPQALALVRDRVVRDYLAQNSPFLFRRLSEETLAAAGFELLG